ncbi:MAG: SCO4848 family membrane protein [Frankia sp.]
MKLSKRWSWFLVGFGVWSWIIWPTFLKNIWKDQRSWHDGPTGFFLVHAVLTAVSLALGTAIGVLGWRARQAERRRSSEPANDGADLVDAAR